MEQTVHFGIDGCKAGWFYIQSTGERIESGVARTLCEIVAAAPDDAVLMVDIPIGLRDTELAPRLCDLEARKLLAGKRASSVFPAPIRAILMCRSHASASALNKELVGKGVTQQAFAIFPKIREVDALLRVSEKARRIIREIHPEVCFWGLNRMQSMLHPKRAASGFEERMAVLRKAIPTAEEIVRVALNDYSRKQVARDDIVDALAALATAQAAPNTLMTVPEVPERDSRGLPMEMVYSLLGGRGT